MGTERVQAKGEWAKTIGIVAGSGPEAGIDLWAKVVTARRSQLGEAYRGDLDAPRVVVYSVPELGLSMELEANEELLWAALEETLIALSDTAGLVCVACNTLHYFAPAIRQLHLRSEFVSMVDPVLRRLSSLKPTSVAILGSQSVLSLGPFSPYANLLTRFRVEIPQDVEAVHALVQRIKERGATQDTILDFERIAASLESPVVVLACTEFSMLPTVSHTRAFIDPAQLLAVELVSRAENAVRNSERR